MELYPVYRKVTVLQSHNCAIFKISRHLKTGGQACALDHQRMIPCGLERTGQSGKQTGCAMLHPAHLAMHDLVTAHHPPAKGLSDGLVPQTDAQKGCLRGGGGSSGDDLNVAAATEGGGRSVHCPQG